jgi:PAS domain S-box-containing protein
MTPPADGSPQPDKGRQPPQLPNSEQLRRKAEQRLGRGDRPEEDLSHLPSRDLRSMVHELRIHQVELEVQNEELRTSQRELAEARDRYRHLYDFAPVGYVTLDARQRITEANLSAARLLGDDRQELIGKAFASFLVAEDADTVYLHLRAAAEADDVCKAEVRVAGEDAPRYVQMDIQPRLSGDGDSSYWVTLTDMTERRRAEQALAGERELLQQLIDNIPVMITIYDPAMQRFRFNRSMTDLLGWTEADTLDGRFMERAYPDKAYRQEVAEYMASLKGGWRDFRVTAKDGSVVDSTWANIRLSDDRVVGIGIDMRERKAAESALRASERRFRSVLTDAPIPVMLHTIDGKIEALSNTFTAITGYTLEDIPTGVEWVRRAYGLSGEAAERADEKIRQRHLECKRLSSDERSIRTKDGQLRIWSFRGARLEPIPSQPAMVVTMAIDVSEEVWARERIRQINASLERQVEGRTAELQQAVNRLEVEASRRELAEQVLLQRSEKLQELNTRLKQRTSQLQKLTLQLSQAEEGERRRIGEILHDHLQQLLVAARFRLSTAGDGSRPDAAEDSFLQEVDGLLEKSLHTCRNLAHELSPPVLREEGLSAGLRWLADKVSSNQGLTVDTDLRAEMPFSSPGLVATLYKGAQELLLNVAKHAETDHAELTTRLVDGQFELCVRDEGKGFEVPPEIDEDSGGMGLFGIRERVRILGGDLELVAAPGQGCQVRLTLPLPSQPPPASDAPSAPGAETASQASAEPTAEEPAGERIRILLVDDHEGVRLGMRSMIDPQNDLHVVGEADTGPRAVELAGEYVPDVVVMDVSLPGMNGVEATRRIKANWPDTRVIGLSIYEEPSLAEEMRQAGAECFLPKSGAGDILLDVIRGAYFADR